MSEGKTSCQQDDVTPRRGTAHGWCPMCHGCGEYPPGSYARCGECGGAGIAQVFTMTLYPEPFPTDDERILTCVACGDQYTMEGYRVFSWEAFSPLCVTCAATAKLASLGITRLGTDEVEV